MLYILPSSGRFVKDRVRRANRFIPVIPVLRGMDVLTDALSNVGYTLLTDALRKGVAPSGPRARFSLPTIYPGGFMPSHPLHPSIMPRHDYTTTQLLHHRYTTTHLYTTTTPPLLPYISSHINPLASLTYNTTSALPLHHSTCPSIRAHMTYTTTHPLHISTHTCLPCLPSLLPTTHLYTTTHTHTHGHTHIPPPAHRRGHGRG